MGSASRADVVADVAQGRPRARATATPASACWSTTRASGRKRSTAASTPGTMQAASGTRNSPTRCLSAAAPRRSSARAAMWSRTPAARGTRSRVASGGSSSATTSSGPAQATSWPRAASSRPTASVGLTCPAMGGTTNRNRVMRRRRKASTWYSHAPSVASASTRSMVATPSGAPASRYSRRRAG